MRVRQRACRRMIARPILDCAKMAVFVGVDRTGRALRPDPIKVDRCAICLRLPAMRAVQLLARHWVERRAVPNANAAIGSARAKAHPIETGDRLIGVKPAGLCVAASAVVEAFPHNTHTQGIAKTITAVAIASPVDRRICEPEQRSAERMRVIRSLPSAGHGGSARAILPHRRHPRPNQPSIRRSVRQSPRSRREAGIPRSP